LKISKISKISRYFRLKISWYYHDIYRWYISLIFPCTEDRNFRQYFLHNLIAQGLAQFVFKFWAKIRRVLYIGTVQVKYKRYEKLAFFDQYLALFRKRYKIRPWLQWKTNRNSCAIYRMVAFLVIFNDRRFQGHDVLNVK